MSKFIAKGATHYAIFLFRNEGAERVSAEMQVLAFPLITDNGTLKSSKSACKIKGAKYRIRFFPLTAYNESIQDEYEHGTESGQYLSSLCDCERQNFLSTMS